MSLPPPDQIKKLLEQALPDLSLTLEGAALFVDPKDLIRFSRYLKDNSQLRMDYLSDVTAVDYPTEQRLDVVYHLYSMEFKHGPITLKVKLPRENPKVASVTPIWRGAEFQEREAYDLYGVQFEGHPDLRRILMWEGFKGHPMRKDYVVEDQNVSQ